MSGASILKMDDKRSADRQKALDSALAQIERQFGKGSIMKLGKDNPVAEIEATSTGSLGLDIALGIGGLPKGRIIEIFGPESSGKTTLTLHVVAEEQKKGGVCAFVDAEHALDPLYARKLGVNLDELLISQPDTGEQALEIVDTLVRSGAVSLVVIDSVAALTPKSEIEGDMGDMQMGSQARLMSQAMRKLTASIGRSNCMVIFINQIRMKIGVMFGNPETTTGGNALKFYASVRLDIRRNPATAGPRMTSALHDAALERGAMPIAALEGTWAGDNQHPPRRRNARVRICQSPPQDRTDRPQPQPVRTGGESARHTAYAADADHSSVRSSPSSGPVPNSSPWLARILSSIAMAMSVCSRRNCLAFSRPCPIRSSP